MDPMETNADRHEVQFEPYQVRFDHGCNSRAKIGFVLIPNEQIIGEDMVRHVPPGVGAYFSRATHAYGDFNQLTGTTQQLSC